MVPVSRIEDQLGIGNEARELIIGKSFHRLASEASSSDRSNRVASEASSSDRSNRVTSSSERSNRVASSSDRSKGDSAGDSFHTLRCDFKPASVDVSKMALMEFSQSNDKVTVTVPNVEASNQPETIFTGSKKAHLKECVLIIDHETGEITLERLTHSINVKKTRVEGKKTRVEEKKRAEGPETRAEGSETRVEEKKRAEGSETRVEEKKRVEGSEKRAEGSSRSQPLQNAPSTPSSSPAPSTQSKPSRLPPPDDIDDFLSF